MAANTYRYHVTLRCNGTQITLSATATDTFNAVKQAVDRARLRLEAVTGITITPLGIPTCKAKRKDFLANHATAGQHLKQNPKTFTKKPIEKKSPFLLD